jgi:hypothetical protein
MLNEEFESDFRDECPSSALLIASGVAVSLVFVAALFLS